MSVQNIAIRLPAVLAILFFSIAGISTALADQVTLAYVDSGGNAQTLTVDVNSSAEDLALAASLVDEDGVAVSHDEANGSGSLADIAAAMATAAPMYAADIADALAELSPDDTEAIVAAINAVAGVNTVAVLAAVHYGDPERDHGPQDFGSDQHVSLELNEIERVPSRN